MVSKHTEPFVNNGVLINGGLLYRKCVLTLGLGIRDDILGIAESAKAELIGERLCKLCFNRFAGRTPSSQVRKDLFDCKMSGTMIGMNHQIANYVKHTLSKLIGDEMIV